MLGIILILAFTFLSIGIYTKLSRFGAPISAILYAGFIPFSVLLFNIILGFKYLTDHKEIKGIKKVHCWVLLQFHALKRFSLINSLFIAKIGSMKLEFWQLFSMHNEFRYQTFKKVKEYIENQIKKVFHCSYEDMLVRY